MYCSGCGANNEAGAVYCVQCGRTLGAGPAVSSPVPPQVQFAGMPRTMPDIPSYMVQSVLVTLCCCLPLGIVGIFKANKVDRLRTAGDFEGAMQASKENKTLLIVAAIVGGVGGLIWGIISVASQSHS